MEDEQTSQKENKEVFYENDEASEKTPEGNEEDKETNSSEETEGDENKDSDQQGDKSDSKDAEDKDSDDDSSSEEEEKEELKLEDLSKSEDSKLTDEQVNEVFEKAKELGLNKEQAQAFLEARDLTNESVTGFAEEQVENAKKEWLEEFKNDPEIGGENAKETAELTKRFLDHYGNDDLRKILNDSPLGNHKELLRVFSKAARDTVANDSFRQGKPSTSGERKSTADVFYEE